MNKVTVAARKSHLTAYRAVKTTNPLKEMLTEYATTLDRWWADWKKLSSLPELEQYRKQKILPQAQKWRRKLMSIIIHPEYVVTRDELMDLENGRLPALDVAIRYLGYVVKLMENYSKPAVGMDFKTALETLDRETYTAFNKLDEVIRRLQVGRVELIQNRARRYYAKGFKNGFQDMQLRKKTTWRNKVTERLNQLANVTATALHKIQQNPRDGQALKPVPAAIREVKWLIANPNSFADRVFVEKINAIGLPLAMALNELGVRDQMVIHHVEGILDMVKQAQDYLDNALIPA